jgi:hypothetical protein
MILALWFLFWLGIYVGLAIADIRSLRRQWTSGRAAWLTFETVVGVTCAYGFGRAVWGW